MRRLSDFGDARHHGYCIHCGGAYETDDHVPPKLWLDDPLPENLTHAPSCKVCNKRCSSDEAYLACLLECVIAGCSEPNALKRPKVANLLASNFKLTELMNSASRIEDGKLLWNVDLDRAKRAILKCARCHAAYEFGEPRPDEPASVTCTPLEQLSQQERYDFENPDVAEIWPEVGSRAMQRLVSDGVYENGWLEVQKDNYRYMGLFDGPLRIRIVLREYLACEVIWD